MTRSVSILLPVLDEANHIESCLDSLVAQDHSGPLEILVAEGGSTDGTTELLTKRAASDPRIVVFPNPRRIQSYGLGLGLERATGDVCIRADAHTTYAPDYVRRNLAVLDEGATLAGGPMLPVGRTTVERAVATAMRSPFGAGPAAFRSTRRRGEVDTVYLGAIRTADLRAAGGFHHLPSGVAEDADLASRIRAAGGSVVLDPAIRSEYRPRGSFRGLWRQFLRYGRGKAEMLRRDGRLPSWRPLAPVGLVLGLVTAAVVAAITGSMAVVAVPVAGWLAATVILVRGGVLAPLAAVVMHVSYGVGFLIGILRGRTPMRRA